MHAAATAICVIILAATVAAAEAAIGLAILVVLFRLRQSINVTDISSLKG